jgi:single-strand DNA-binding protein
MLNKVMLIGNLGKDPEVRYTQGGQAVAKLTVATSRSWTDKNSGQRKEETEWHEVEAWGKQAESCGKYLAKGRQVYVEGRIKTEKWQDKQTGADKYRTKIVADDVRFLGGDKQRAPRASEPAESADHGDDEQRASRGDDIPF